MGLISVFKKIRKYESNRLNRIRNESFNDLRDKYYTNQISVGKSKTKYFNSKAKFYKEKMNYLKARKDFYKANKHLIRKRHF